MSSKTAVDMRWHYEERVKDGVLRHPANSEAWKSLDRIRESFGNESRNVRLGLATDGFNPFGNMSVKYSLWPILLFPYNLPPWMLMKEPYVFMSLLIPGKKGPGQDIDVYMRPLIDELQDLWGIGVETYDISKKQNFQMRAAIMWTINDYPAYAYMSGWSTQGKLACPCCGSNTSHLNLHHGSKQFYMGHRRFLQLDHSWLNQKMQFDNTREKRVAPTRPLGIDMINELSELREITHNKNGTKQTIAGFGKTHNWKKHSIFFKLPYWKTLLLRHNLDVMHIEKNVFENVIGTVMNIDGETKDSLNARLDLQEMGIRSKLHPIEEAEKIIWPKADYELSNNDKKAVFQWLMNLKVPDGYSANISRCVNAIECIILGMKTHDCHVFLERLIPLVARELLLRDECDALIEFSYFFRELCAKVLRIEDLELLENEIVLTFASWRKYSLLPFSISWFTYLVT
ncbi:PREDICTED: LOC109704191 isoform [Prunus dulcis]|uniref:PREDICTED: LOC109704191 isoform n=1 Tax=Prunus dulcis TaxID=3755 RepID=A0A5E4FFE1_PRUDU|nr:PREDICTED: LOC109704191 isoform [Prunus dulcis]